MASGGGCLAGNGEAIYSLVHGVDGNTVSFDLRINSLVFPVSNTTFSVSVSCGDFFQSFPYSPTDVGSIIFIATTITGSNGGGVITISLSIGTSSFASSASYSTDIDNFITNPGLDPDNACLQALPVTFISFTAQKETQQARLVWATSVKQNSKGFDIQRSTDARQWKSVGFVNSQQANSDARINYSW